MGKTKRREKEKNRGIAAVFKKKDQTVCDRQRDHRQTDRLTTDRLTCRKRNIVREAEN